MNSQFANYFGETERTMNNIFQDHKGYVQNRKTNHPTGEHFTSKGHQLSDMVITILEQISSTDPLYRKERERYLIRKFNSYNNGLNKSPGS